MFVWIQVYHKRHPHPTDELRPVTKLKREGKLDSVVRNKTGRPCDGVDVEYAGTSCVPVLRPRVEYESSRSGQSHGMPPHASIERRSHFHRLPAVSQHPSKAVKNRNLLTTCQTACKTSEYSTAGLTSHQDSFKLWGAWNRSSPREVVHMVCRRGDLVVSLGHGFLRGVLYEPAEHVFLRRKRCPTSSTSSKDKNIVDAPQICKTEAL